MSALNNNVVICILHVFVLAKKQAIYDQFGEEGLRNGVPDSDTG